MSNACFNNNRLLQGLPADEMKAVQSQLVSVPLVREQVLTGVAQPVFDYYFVTRGLVSLTMLTNGHADESMVCEVGLIGDDGLVGTSALLAPKEPAPNQAVVQIGGEALRVSISTDLFAECPTLQSRVLRYTVLLMQQMGQIAACNLRHTVQERLSRWLLMTRDRLHEDTLPLTQEFLAIMLGVRRAGVSVAANTLQAAGLVRLGRGRITVTDVAGLESTACQCYQTMQRLYDTAY